MREPVVSLHIPKCGGTSLQELFFSAFAPTMRVLQFYPDINVFLQDDWFQPNTIIHGHFIRWQNHEVESICKGCTKFISLIRDPYEVCVSAYHYGRAKTMAWALDLEFNDFIDWWCQNSYGPLLGALPEWPANESVECYINKFLAIGLLNEIDSYIDELSHLFSLKLSPSTKQNSTPRQGQLPDLRDQLAAAHPRDFELFNHVAAKYEATK